MIKSKIFSVSGALVEAKLENQYNLQSRLEAELNDWLANNNVEVLNIGYTAVKAATDFLSCIIFYREV